MKKTCSHCGEDKPETEYYARGKRGFFAKCKQCVLQYNRAWKKENQSRQAQYKNEWGKTAKGYRQRMWTSMNQRCGKGSYQKVMVKITKKEWYEFATPLIEAFLRDHPGSIPSVDRKDPKLHYELGNLQIIPWESNLDMSSVFMESLGVDATSPEEVKLWALKAIMEGQCKLLKMPIASLLSHLGATSRSPDGP